MIEKLFRKILLVIIGAVFVPQAGSVSPIKQCDSLGRYSEMHERMANASLQCQAELIANKIDLIENLVSKIGAIENDLEERMRSLEIFEQPPHGKEYLQISVKSISQPLKSKQESIYSRLAVETSGEFPDRPVNHENFSERLQCWQDKLISQILEGISKGDYAPLISTFPSGFYVNAHIPNTFLCAFSFITEERREISVLIHDPELSKKLSLDSIFMSGSTGLDYSGISLILQTTALGGMIPAGKAKVSGPQDLYRHSEQVAFQELAGRDFINGVTSYVKESIGSDKVKEIVFHGHTFRDMCPNCRATLVGHIVHTIRRSLYQTGNVVVDSFLLLLQNGCLERFGSLPIVTSVISSFLPYSPRTPANGWDKTPCASLLDPKSLAPSGICSSFVNQFAFSEADFLTKMIDALKEQNSAGGSVLMGKVIEELGKRLSNITEVSSSLPSDLAADPLGEK